MLYLVADSHFYHKNIIEYCDRPFETVSEMNEHLITNWNQTVSSSDIVLFGGDLLYGVESESISPEELLSKLNGKIIWIQGNHDSVSQQDISTPLCTEYTFNYGKYTFKYIHNPEKVQSPHNYDWLIHGHTHNNELYTYPFIEPDNKTCNVSVETINYTPISIEEVITYCEQKTMYMTRPT